jgi:hypothetical protein
MKFKKQQSNLDRRRHDFHLMIAKGSRESKVDLRMNTNGFHCLGSNKK